MSATTLAAARSSGWEKAADTASRDQPNSCSNGSISTPVLDRKPAAQISAPKVTSATSHARCTRGRRRAPLCLLVTAPSWPTR